LKKKNEKGSGKTPQDFTISSVSPSSSKTSKMGGGAERVGGGQNLRAQFRFFSLLQFLLLFYMYRLFTILEAIEKFQIKKRKYSKKNNFF